VQYQSDYILRLIEQMGSLIRQALEEARSGASDEPYELAEQALGLALDIDPSVAARLSPQSLASMLDLSSLDDRVLELVAQALEVEADAREKDGGVMESTLRREQAAAVRALVDPQRAN